ncbi:hypothetical protein ABZ897_25890 [Nonomuraea sp. NPDC046802]|uniref:hypothetical protein n=1 Tax=Nonomuraea sp. NPDC046802 TaxID=3154919 RepID=UPI0033C86A40
MTQDVDHVVARFAAPPVTEVSEGAKELMHEIMAAESPAEARRRPRRWIAIPAGALLTAATVALTWMLPNSTASALDIKREGDHYVIQIKDLYADPGSYETQLRTVGLDVSLTVVPTTAAFEGQVFPVSPDKKYITEITGIYPPGPCDKLDGCAIGVKIPVDFKGTASIEVGRKAEPGERYQSTTGWDAKGEPMHCIPYRNKTVAEVRDMLKERGIRIEEFVVGDPNRTTPGDFEIKDTVPDSWLVSGGSLTEPGVATVIASEIPTSQEIIDRVDKANGCPSS